MKRKLNAAEYREIQDQWNSWKTWEATQRWQQSRWMF